MIEPAQFFKVAKIERRCKRVEETSWLVRWVTERMDGSNGHHDERALTGPQRLRPCQKLQFAFKDVKALFMRMMDMRRRCWFSRGGLCVRGPEKRTEGTQQKEYPGP